MTTYVPGTDNDIWLLNWYARLASNGDLQKLVGPSLWPMAAFMQHFTNPYAVLFVEGDGEGWYAVSWIFPLIGGGTWGLWIREDKRPTGNRQIVNFIMSSLEIGLTYYPVLVNTTKQPEIVEKTKKLGYRELGTIPALFEGEDCHILYMTREMFAPLLEKWSRYYERWQDKHAE